MTVATAATGHARTRRSPHGAFAGTGAVRQRDGSLPVYICTTCGEEVVWAESARTGRKYLANVRHGHSDQRFYVAASVHSCAPTLDRREQSRRDTETNAHFAFLFRLMDEHDAGGHAKPAPMCRRCDRGQTRADLADEALS